MKKKEGQITYFMLLGLFTFMILGASILLFASYETGTKADQNKIAEDSLLASQLKYYVISCLDTVSDRAFFIAGQQAGAITKRNLTKGGQPDLISLDIATSQIPNPNRAPGVFGIPYRDENGNYYFINYYAIKEPRFDDTRNKKEKPPFYPYPGPLTSDLNKINFDDPFGHADSSIGWPTNFNALCNTLGSNKKIMQGASYSCEDELYYKSDTTSQDYIEGYIEQELAPCVLSTFRNDEPGVQAMPGNNPAVNVMFGDNYTYVVVDYPFRFTSSQGHSYTDAYNYMVFKPIRYKLIYELGYHIAKRDVGDIFFNKSDLYHIKELKDCARFTVNSGTGSLERTDYTMNCLLPNISVSVIHNPCGNPCENPKGQKGKYADIVVIKDNLSSVLGKPYEFKFLAADRAPALDYIDESISNELQPYLYSIYSGYYYYLMSRYAKSPDEIYNGTRYIEQKLADYKANNPTHYAELALKGISPDPKAQNYNIVAYAGEAIHIKPRGIDPDEDSISYKYSGWRTPIAICNHTYSAGTGDYDCTEGVTSQMFKSLTGNKGRAYEDQYFSPSRKGLYTSGGVPNGEDGYENKNYWETSPEYIATSKDASYTTSHYDVGYHWVRVMVEDEGGNYDYQDIKIQVRCDPTEPLTGGCCDVNNDYHPAEAGSKGSCNACHSCNAAGECAPDINLHRDCGACAKCSWDGFGDLQCTSEDNDISGECMRRVSSRGSDSRDAMCCGGICYDTTESIIKPWKEHDRNSACYMKSSISDSKGDGKPFCRLDYESGKKKLTYPINIKGECTGDKGCVRCALGGAKKGECTVSEANAFVPDKNINADLDNFYYDNKAGAEPWIGTMLSNFLGQCQATCNSGRCGASTATEQITAINAQNQPVTGAVVDAYMNGNLIQSKTTGSDGVTLFSNLAVGTYNIHIKSEGYKDRADIFVTLNGGASQHQFTLNKECSCDGKECGDDGCGGSCGACKSNEQCQNDKCA